MSRTLLAILIFVHVFAAADVFRISLLTEPHSLDPQILNSSSGNFLFNNIYSGLYRYHSKRGLIKEGAKECVRQRLAMICKLNPAHKWNNGTPIKAEDYVRAFRRLVDPELKSPQSELIFSLKNAREIWTGKASPDSLGVKAKDEFTLQFDFASEDVEFEYKLTNSALTPWPAAGLLAREKSPQMLFSGPYQISGWKPGHWVRLSANKSYGLPANPRRPDVEVLFLESDSTSLRLYESGKLSFLRRLPAGEIPRFKSSPDFLQVPVSRFDYVGFGPQLIKYPKLREALTMSVDYASFLQLFDTKGPPGCPSLPTRFMDRTKCFSFTPEKAKALLAKEDKLPKLEYRFSQLGGDDIARAAEWFQGQWKKNLSVSVSLSGQEQLGYLALLRSDPPPLFRKGVSLDRPTCLAAVELFSKDSRENYIHFAEPEFEKLLAVLRRPLGEKERKVACRKAVEFLMNSHRLIPLGEMYFTILASRKFRGWDLNELNQLDLTDLAEVQ